MSGSSSTPGREAQFQPSNPRIYRAMGEEIDRLTTELERAHAREARLREDFEAQRTAARQWQSRAEGAERELSRIQGSFPEFNNLLRAMITGQVVDDGNDAIFVPGDTEDVHMTDDESTPVIDPSSIRRSERDSETSEPLLPHAPNTFSHIGSDLQQGSSLRRSSFSGSRGPSNGFETGLQDLEGFSSQRLSPPLQIPTHPRPPPHQPSLAETISPRDHHAAPSHVISGITDVNDQPEYHADMHEGLPAVREISSLNASTAPAIPRRHTPIPQIVMSTWEALGVVNRNGIDGSHGIPASYFAGWPDVEEPDTGDQPEIKSLSQNQES